MKHDKGGDSSLPPNTAHDLAVHRANAFQNLPSTALGKTYSEASKRKADSLWPLIRTQPSFNRRAVVKKRQALRYIYHSLSQAHCEGGCVRYPRGHGDISKATLNIITCVAEAGLAERVDSVSGGHNHSRLIPCGPEWSGLDPKVLDRRASTQYVRYLKRRRSKVQLPISIDDHILHETQTQLELINSVNSQFKITYQPHNVVTKEFGTERSFNPVMRRYFYASSKGVICGRIYTPGKYGHQRRSKIERSTIQFDGEACVEWDYSSLHTRMIYHILGHDYPDDPYALRRNTIDEQRELVKKLANTLYNARKTSGAIKACRNAMCLKTRRGDDKTGKRFVDAVDLQQWLQKTGLTFPEIFDLLVKRHPMLVPYFGTDAGFKQLMPLDSRIAMGVMYELAALSIPVLGVHDSFVVPSSHEGALKAAMIRHYREQPELHGFNPVINKVNAR